MKAETYESTEERAVLTAMIVNDTVLGRIASRWEGDGDFAQRYANQVGWMCVKYYRQYGKAPGARITELFASWADGRPDKDSVKLVESFLASLSEDYEASSGRVDPDYATDQAAKHFSKVRFLQLSVDIKSAYDAGRPERAEEAFRKFRKVELGPEADVNVFHDEESWADALKGKDESIIKYPGAAGEFFRDALSKGNFISFLAPPKRGKTFNMMDMAWRGAMQRRRVAFLEIGDMTKPQIMRRFLVRAACRPLRPRIVKYPRQLLVDGVDPFVEHEDIVYDSPLTLAEAKAGFEKAIRTKVKSNDDYLKLRVYPAMTVTVERIANMIDDWCQSGWVPEVIVIDYADLIASSKYSNDDFRHKTNEIWAQLRAISQGPSQPLVVTATQANRASYTAGTVGMEHASEDMRKAAHVTGMIGISAKAKEKEMGVVRLNWCPLREDEFNAHKCVYLAQCLPIANPCVLSSFRNLSESSGEEEETHKTRNGRAKTNGRS